MSLRKAIDGKCRDCSYDPEDKGTWRQQVQSCSDFGCHLHPYRPISGNPLPKTLMQHWRLENQPPGGQK